MKRNVSLKETKKRGATRENDLKFKESPDFVVASTEAHDGEKIAARVEVFEPIVECTCCGYEGQDYLCRLHSPKVECPSCRCIDAGIVVPDALPSVTHYRCAICGVFYMRNIENGDYLYVK